jgi:hypothetical protein
MDLMVGDFSHLLNLFNQWIFHDSITNDAPPSSLMDLTTSPKMKTTKGKGVGVRSWLLAL